MQCRSFTRKILDSIPRKAQVGGARVIKRCKPQGLGDDDDEIIATGSRFAERDAAVLDAFRGAPRRSSRLTRHIPSIHSGLDSGKRGSTIDSQFCSAASRETSARSSSAFWQTARKKRASFSAAVAAASVAPAVPLIAAGARANTRLAATNQLRIALSPRRQVGAPAGQGLISLSAAANWWFSGSSRTASARSSAARSRCPLVLSASPRA